MLLIPIVVSLALLLYSWSRSYPISISSPTDFVFNHIHPLFWISLAVLLGSIGTVAAIIENDRLVLIACVAILLCMYSVYYFYPTLPGSDTNTFRGLTEYATTTGDMNPLVTHHTYYQWPGFFVFSQIVTCITGLQTIPLEFVLFTILGILYVTALYGYFSSFSKKFAWAAIIAYFIIIYWFFNYQYAPFSLAMGLLFTLFMIETRPVKTVGLTLISLVLCTGIAIIHPFAVVFFIAYALVMYLLGRNKYYRNLFSVVLVIWLAVTIFSKGIFFNQVLQAIVYVTTQEYASSLQATLSLPLFNLPGIYFTAQTFSRTLIIATGLIAALGLILLLRKKRLRQIDLALLISASFYSLVGIVMDVMGQRAWFILLMPLSLGAIYFLEYKFSKHIKTFLVILLILFAFIPLSASFNTQVFFQTKKEEVTTDFAIAHYNWFGSGSVLTHFRLLTYIESKTAGTVQFGSEFQFTKDYWTTFPQNIPTYNCIIYTSGLAQRAYAYNYSIDDLWQNQKYNRAYDTGQSYILVDSIPLQP